MSNEQRNYISALFRLRIMEQISMKKEHIPILALLISAVSLLVSIASIYIQYKEELIITEGVKVCSEIDLESKSLQCEIELMLSNTSHTPFSIITCEVRKGWQNYTFTTSRELPILLSQGESEKLTVYVNYPLSDDDIAILQNSNNDLSTLKGWFYIELATPKEEYSTTIRMSEFTPDS